MAGVRTSVDLRLDYGAINRMLKGESGPVGRHMVVIADKTVDGARVNAPVRSGDLRRSISITSVQETTFGTEVLVSANIEYALAVHQGAKPHVIEARNAPMLRFPAKSGFIVYTPRVNHPGNKPNPFLWEALVAAVR